MKMPKIKQVWKLKRAEWPYPRGSWFVTRGNVTISTADSLYKARQVCTRMNRMVWFAKRARIANRRRFKRQGWKLPKNRR